MPRSSRPRTRAYLRKHGRTTSDQGGLALVAIPANPLCIEDDALDTLYTAHAMMELIDALDCNEGTSEFEMPKSGSGSVASLRKLVLDSMQYAADLEVRLRRWQRSRRSSVTLASA